MGEITDGMRGGGDAGGGEHQFQVSAPINGRHTLGDLDEVGGERHVAFGSNSGALLKQLAYFVCNFGGGEEGALELSIMGVNATAKLLAARSVAFVKAPDAIERRTIEAKFQTKPREVGRRVGGGAGVGVI